VVTSRISSCSTLETLHCPPPPNVFMYSLWFSECTKIVSLSRSNRSVFVMETECVYWEVEAESLGAFAILRKATISFIMSVRPSIQPHGTTWPPLDGFSRYLIFEYFSKIFQKKFKFHENRTRMNYTLHEYQCIFLIISRPVLLRMRNVSDKSCRENQNTHIVFSNFFSQILLFMG
jgi:hypothetical protein